MNPLDRIANFFFWLIRKVEASILTPKMHWRFVYGLSNALPEEQFHIPQIILMIDD
jgi:hypothetical protein